MSENMPSFDSITQTLAAANSLISSSEAHGLLCGMICTGNKIDEANWVEHIHAGLAIDLSESQQADTLLRTMDGAIRYQLQDINFSFQLLLPCDETNLRTRTQALTLWCQGFLCGLGLGGFKLEDDLPTEIREGLEHMASLSQLNLADIEVCEDDEEAYMEVSEYIRTLIFAMFDNYVNHLNQHNIH